MKKLSSISLMILIVLVLQLCTAAAEDAVSSATLSVNALPQVQENENASVLECVSKSINPSKKRRNMQLECVSKSINPSKKRRNMQLVKENQKGNRE